jgi:hypothetical protein
MSLTHVTNCVCGRNLIGQIEVEDGRDLNCYHSRVVGGGAAAVDVGDNWEAAGFIGLPGRFRERGCRSIIMIVMLSPPIPWVARGSSLMIVSNISIPISDGVIRFMRLRTNSTAFSLVRQSQMPSHPRIRNSSLSSRVNLVAKTEKGQNKEHNLQGR